MLAGWRGGTFKEGLPHFKRQKGCFKGEYLNSPKGLRRHSSNEPPKAKANASIGTKSTTGWNGAEDLVAKKEQGHEDVWTKLLGRANEDKILLMGNQ